MSALWYEEIMMVQGMNAMERPRAGRRMMSLVR